jgi:hypothetical protein
MFRIPGPTPSLRPLGSLFRTQIYKSQSIGISIVPRGQPYLYISEV